MTGTPFHFQFYKCVAIFITIERIVKILFLFWANGPLKSKAEPPYTNLLLDWTQLMKNNVSTDFHNTYNLNLKKNPNRTLVNEHFGFSE